MPAPQKKVGSYHLVSQVGSGGLSEVFLALKEGNAFALKCLKAERVKVQRNIDDFIREVKIGTTLSHENILGFVDHGKSNDTYFAVMELVVGLSVQQMQNEAEQKEKKIPLPFALYVIEETAKALKYLHHTSVFENSNSVTFHGDVSPQNVMVAQDGRVLLVDFGSAGQNTPADPRETPLGKMYYLPPDVLEKKPVTTATDLYSLGIMAFYLLFGKRPYEAPNKMDLFKAILRNPLPRLECGDIVKSLRDEGPLRIFFNQALHKDPKMRFQTVEEFTDAFSKLHFAQDRPKSRSEFLTYVSKEDGLRFEAIAKDWTDRIREYKTQESRSLERKAGTLPVESLLTRIDKRRFPRIEISENKVQASVLASNERVRVKVPVTQLSQGGMLVKWEGLVPRIGSTYPVTIELEKNAQPIQTEGKLLYEIHRQARPFVAFQFVTLGSVDQKKLKDYVKTRFIPVSDSSIDSGTQEATFDVFFENADFFQEEYEKNIRNGGMFIRSPRALKNDEIIIVRIQVGQDLHRVAIKGKVVYCTPMDTTEKISMAFGLGLQLMHSMDQLKDLFAKYLTTH